MLDRVVFFDARQSEVEAAEFEAEVAVVDSQAVQDGGLHVVDVDRVLDDAGCHWGQVLNNE